MKHIVGESTNSKDFNPDSENSFEDIDGWHYIDIMEGMRCVISASQLNLLFRQPQSIREEFERLIYHRMLKKIYRVKSI